jgi:hypothetical protein
MAGGRPEGMSPRRWRRLQERWWDRPLQGEQLRRVRETLLDSWSCAGALTSTTRRVLIMRAGLFGRAPASRRTIARRLGLTLRGELRAEVLGYTRLARAGTCIAAGGAALGTNVSLATGAGSAAGGQTFGPLGGPDRLLPSDFDKQGVLGVSKSHTPPARLGDSETGHGLRNTLLAFLAVLLALLSAVLLVAGRRAAPVAAARGSSRKPVLFLDIDHSSARARALVRMLRESFEILGLNGPASSDEKIARIEYTVGDRPLAWVDGSSEPAHARWASKREAPTFIVQPEPSTGLSEEDVATLLVFAESARDDEDAGAGGAARRAGSPRALTRP